MQIDRWKGVIMRRKKERIAILLLSIVILAKHFKLVDPWQDSRLWQSRGDRSTGADGEYVASLFCKRGL